MKRMKLFNWERDQFSKTFLNVEKRPSKFKYINFRGWSSIEILIKINFEKTLK